MKKIASLMLLLAMASSANADLVLKTEEDSLRFCPGVFSTNGASIAYSISKISRGKVGGDITIYNQDFLVEKTFSSVTSEYQTVSFTEEATVIPTGVTVVPEDQYGNKNYSMHARWEASSQEEMINKLKEEYSWYTFTEFTDVFGNPACYYENDFMSYSFAYENIFEKKYPYSWYALIEGMVYEFSVSYYNDNFYTLAYDEESAVWTRTSENIATYSNSPISSSFEIDCVEGRSVEITQAFFNNDDKWEYILPEYGPLEFFYDSSIKKQVNDDGTVTLTRSGYGKSKLLGYAVYNEDGVKLGVFQGRYFKGIYVMNGRKFVEMLDDQRIDNKIQYTHSLYEIKNGNDDSDFIETVQAKSNRRLGAARGIVTVDINAEQAGGEVVVSTVDGKVMTSKRVSEGRTQVNDKPLPPGIYIVSLLKDNRVLESEKYIVQ